MPELPGSPGPGLPAPIGVLLVDDHEMVADSLSRAINAEPDLSVVGVAGTVRHSVELARTLQPHVILMDMRLPDGDGTDAIEAIRSIAPDSRIVVLSGFGDQISVARAMTAGCSGFLDKSAPLPELLDAVRRAHRGEVILGMDDLTYLRASLTTPDDEVLTPRETEILHLLAEGLSNRAIADRLIISNDTVRTHVQRVLTKLGAHSRLEAVAIARRTGRLP